MKYGETREISFCDWYSELREIMSSKESHDGLPLDPDGWCEKDRWKQHYKQKLTPMQAYIFEL